MTGPEGNSKLCFPRISMFPETSSRETLRFSGNKIHCSPQDQSLNVNYYVALSHKTSQRLGATKFKNLVDIFLTFFFGLKRC